MPPTNDWATFGLVESKRPKKRRLFFRNVDTSRMSWHDCHVGYTFLAIPFLFGFPWCLAGVIAMLNGGYASAFTVRPPGAYSRPLWWLALFASLIIFALFTTMELSVDKKDGFGSLDILVLVIITKLAIGQLLFLIRI